MLNCPSNIVKVLTLQPIDQNSNAVNRRERVKLGKTMWCERLK